VADVSEDFRAEATGGELFEDAEPTRGAAVDAGDGGHGGIVARRRG
jgi:hypothetical protein